MANDDTKVERKHHPIFHDPNFPNLTGFSAVPACPGVKGTNDGGGVGVLGVGATGVLGDTDNGDGVRGVSRSKQHAGVSCINDGGGFGVWAKGTPAGNFEGDVAVNGNMNVTGNVTANGDIILANADCAEDFDILGAEPIEPGTVMVLSCEGALQQSRRPYDKKVAGVISGAGDYKPAITLDKRRGGENRQPLALMGKVYCKVDARYSAIEVGDLMTTSLTPGHAMKADDSQKAFGAVIGKALRGLPRGRGLIPILISLQ